MGRLRDLWQADPKAALESEFENTKWYPVGRMHCSTIVIGTDGVGYFSYKVLNRKDLVGRRFVVEFWDGYLSITFVDVLCDLDHWKNETPRYIPNPKASEETYRSALGMLTVLTLET